jgi:hypothetical protein
MASTAQAGCKFRMRAAFAQREILQALNWLSARILFITSSAATL